MITAELSAESRSVCTTSEAARLLGVSNTTIQIMVERGELKAWRTRGGHRRISLDSVQSVQRQRGVTNGRHGGEADVLTVLVVDSDPDMCDQYVSTMAQWGRSLHVLTAADGLEALLLIERRRPEILITELSMPNMDGFEFLRKLRTHHEFDSTQIIVVTALADDEIVRHGTIPVGVAVYKKPAPFEKIQGFIEAHMLRRELNRV